jgi:hypothetical protein
LIREVLRDDYYDLVVEKVAFEEDIREGSTNLEATIAPAGATADDSRRRVVKGAGVGVVDAFFRGLIAQMSPEYPSLKTLSFVGFSIDAKIADSHERSHTDAVGEAKLIVENQKGDHFEFVAASRSIIASSLQATLRAVEYFVNSERAFFTTRRALKDAEQRGRADLVRTFAARLTELVQNTSYSEAIEAKKE